MQLNSVFSDAGGAGEAEMGNIIGVSGSLSSGSIGNDEDAGRRSSNLNISNNVSNGSPRLHASSFGRNLLDGGALTATMTSSTIASSASDDLMKQSTSSSSLGHIATANSLISSSNLGAGSEAEDLRSRQNNSNNVNDFLHRSSSSVSNDIRGLGADSGHVTLLDQYANLRSNLNENQSHSHSSSSHNSNSFDDFFSHNGPPTPQSHARISSLAFSNNNNNNSNNSNNNSNSNSSSSSSSSSDERGAFYLTTPKLTNHVDNISSGPMDTSRAVASTELFAMAGIGLNGLVNNSNTNNSNDVVLGVGTGAVENGLDNMRLISTQEIHVHPQQQQQPPQQSVNVNVSKSKKHNKKSSKNERRSPSMETDSTFEQRASQQSRLSNNNSNSNSNNNSINVVSNGRNENSSNSNNNNSNNSNNNNNNNSNNSNNNNNNNNDIRFNLPRFDIKMERDSGGSNSLHTNGIGSENRRNDFSKQIGNNLAHLDMSGPDSRYSYLMQTDGNNRNGRIITKTK